MSGHEPIHLSAWPQIQTTAVEIQMALLEKLRGEAIRLGARPQHYQVAIYDEGVLFSDLVRDPHYSGCQREKTRDNRIRLAGRQGSSSLRIGVR